MNDEYSTLLKNNTWHLVFRPTDRKSFDVNVSLRSKETRMVISRYKARLVVRGFHQEADLDYVETFSSVVKQLPYGLYLLLLSIMDGSCAKLI